MKNRKTHIEPSAMPDGVKPDERLIAMLDVAIRQLACREKYEAEIIVRAPSQPEAPEMSLRMERRDRKITDIKVVCYRPDGDGERSKFTFPPTEAETAASFVTWYFSTEWNVGPSELVVGRYEFAYLVSDDGEKKPKCLPLDESYNLIIPEDYSLIPTTPAEQVFEEIEDMGQSILASDNPREEARRLLRERKAKRRK